MASFIGSPVRVVLKSPPNTQVHGVVTAVEPGVLSLKNVLWNGHGPQLPYYTLRSDQIGDIEVAPSQPVEDDSTTPIASIHGIPETFKKHHVFADPAILSTRRKEAPTSLSLPSHTIALPLVISPVMIADGEADRGRIHLGESSVSSITTAAPTRKGTRRDSTATATLTEPFDALSLSGTPGVADAQDSSRVRKVKQKQRHIQSPGLQNASGLLGLQDLPNGGPSSRTGKGRGWRQTPLVEELPKKSQKSKRLRKTHEDDLNGWATEDATEIEAMGDFDFEQSNLTFDKKQVFAEIRKEDQITFEERLVGHNRVVRPGTNGGRNLAFNENVLDPTPQSEAGETEDDVREEHYSSSRGAKRASSNRPPTSRKPSLFPAGRTESPQPLRRMGTSSPANGSIAGTFKNFLQVYKTSRPCMTVSPLQMLELEQLTTSELQMSEDQLAENAATGIAASIMKEQPKNVLVVVGNHKTGARAIAAARHLRNRKVRVTVVGLGFERSDMLLEPVRTQLSTYRACGGFTDRWDEWQAKLATAPPPDLILDALLVYSDFYELRSDDQATALTMIRWMNRCPASTWSLEIPSGISASTGVGTEVDGGGPLVMDVVHVVCLAAPKTGLVAAEIPINLRISVVDIGIPPTAWHKYGSRRRHGAEFGGDWVVDLKIVPV